MVTGQRFDRAPVDIDEVPEGSLSALQRRLDAERVERGEAGVEIGAWNSEEQGFALVSNPQPVAKGICRVGKQQPLDVLRAVDLQAFPRLQSDAGAYAKPGLIRVGDDESRCVPECPPVDGEVGLDAQPLTPEVDLEGRGRCRNAQRATGERNPGGRGERHRLRSGAHACQQSPENGSSRYHRSLPSRVGYNNRIVPCFYPPLARREDNFMMCINLWGL